jgi:hypothetical protein
MKKQIYIIFRFVCSYYIPNHSLLIILLLPEIFYIKRLKEIDILNKIIKLGYTNPFINIFI